MQRAEHRGLELAGEGDGQDQGECRVLTPDRGLKCLAARAAIDVGARDAPGRHPSGMRGQPLTDLRARVLPGVLASQEALARLEDQRLHLLSSDLQNRGDFFVRVVTQLEQHQSCALIFGKALYVLEELVQLFPALHLVGNALGERPLGHDSVHLDDRALTAKLRQAAIARDRVEPRPYGNFLPTPEQRSIGRDERQLQRVFSRLAATEHVRTEGQEARRVAVVDGLEGVDITGSHPADQVVVSLGHQRSTTDRSADGGECGICPHLQSVRQSGAHV